MDTIVHYSLTLEGSEARRGEPRSDVLVRTAEPADTEAVRDIAARAFAGYASHYHADPKLDARAADEAYADWAYRSCVDRNVANEVLVAEDEGGTCGFLTLRERDPDTDEIVLNAVAPASQERGIYRALLSAALDRSSKRRQQRVVTSTQKVNVIVQHIWRSVGFEPIRSEHTYHLWL